MTETKTQTSPTSIPLPAGVNPLPSGGSGPGGEFRMSCETVVTLSAPIPKTARPRPMLCQRVEYDSFTEPWRRAPIALRRQPATADTHSAGNAADSQNTTGLPAVSWEFVSDVGCFVPGLKLSSRSEVPPLIGRARYRPLLFRRAGKCCGRFESRCPSKSTPAGCFRTRR